MLSVLFFCFKMGDSCTKSGKKVDTLILENTEYGYLKMIYPAHHIFLVHGRYLSVLKCSLMKDTDCFKGNLVRIIRALSRDMWYDYPILLRM